MGGGEAGVGYEAGFVGEGALGDGEAVLEVGDEGFGLGEFAVVDGEVGSGGGGLDEAELGGEAFDLVFELGFAGLHASERGGGGGERGAAAFFDAALAFENELGFFKKPRPAGEVGGGGLVTRGGVVTGGGQLVAEAGEGGFFAGDALFAFGNAAGERFEFDFFAGNAADVLVKFGQDFVEQVAGPLEFEGEGDGGFGLTLHGVERAFGVAGDLAAEEEGAGGEGDGGAEGGFFDDAGDEHGESPEDGLEGGKGLHGGRRGVTRKMTGTREKTSCGFW